MKPSEKIIIQLVESKIKRIDMINYKLLPLIHHAEDLNELEYRSMKKLGWEQGQIIKAIANILKMLT